MGMANAIYNAGYRKMDEVTLKLDLGDRTPEEIKQIAEMFNGKIKKQVAKKFASFIKSKLFDFGNVLTEKDIDKLLKEWLRNGN